MKTENMSMLKEVLASNNRILDIIASDEYNQNRGRETAVPCKNDILHRYSEKPQAANRDSSYVFKNEGVTDVRVLDTQDSLVINIVVACADYSTACSIMNRVVTIRAGKRTVTFEEAVDKLMHDSDPKGDLMASHKDHLGYELLNVLAPDIGDKVFCLQFANLGRHEHEPRRT